MKLWFNTEKKGFNQLGDYIWLDVDYRSIGCTLKFDEMRFIANDDGSFVVGMNLLGGKDISDKVSMRDFPIPVALWVRPQGAKYEIYSMEDKKKIEIESQELEQVIILGLKHLDPAKFYSGELSLAVGSYNTNILAAPELIDKLSPFNVKEIEQLDKLKDLRLESSKVNGKSGSGSGGKNYGQTQAQKLVDTQNHLLSMAKEFYKVETMSLDDLYVFAVSDTDKYEWFAATFKLIK